jgi:hypothetical protein
MHKKSKIIILAIATAVLLVAVSVIALGSAQNTGTVIVLDVAGGTTDVTGTTTYPDGTTVSITATPSDQNYAFNSWVVSTTAGESYNTVDNPISLTVAAGVTYAVQPLFDIVQAVPGQSIPTDISTAAIVVVLSSAGGTTSPAPGTYALANAAAFDIKATPNSGWQFSHWVISGPNLSHGGYPFTATPTDNPYNVNHGYGNAFSYQAVFSPIGSTEPTPTVPEFPSIATIIVAITAVTIAVGTYGLKRKTK